MIMHVITNFTASAGAETMLARLLRTSEDERIIVVSLIGVSDRNRNLANNPRVTYVALGSNSVTGLSSAIPRLAALIRRERPKAILCWMYHAMVAGTLGAVVSRQDMPVFWNVRQSLDDPASLSRSSRMAIAFAKKLSGRAAGIIYNSSRARELHQAYGFSDRNSVVIPNGFDLPQVNPPEPKAARRFGIAARFHPQKDHETFFRAAALVAQTHPEATFAAGGHGLSRNNPAVSELITKAGLSPESIDLMGEVADMPGFYQGIDVLVLSSRTEGFPNVIAEAMSFCKPVVTTDVGDAAAVIGDTGIAVPPRDPAALALAMCRILELSPEAYARLAMSARQRIESHYALPAIAQSYTDFVDGY
ncbi:glycosyltransferase [Sinorhizobium sp. BG8]|uniref:glycosyltransferase n=1 Tax=Sinorhizobium sp. BG8 TaxID=2613773 RepID=UPI00193CE123|nr:glycosyltransferase [Sinorhizobium sp. BG8]QRM57705.1 glycosyltransferase [Sinorhizobium sp. BG8]